jgi:hypothetical protein
MYAINALALIPEMAPDRALKLGRVTAAKADGGSHAFWSGGGQIAPHVWRKGSVKIGDVLGCRHEERNDKLVRAPREYKEGFLGADYRKTPTSTGNIRQVPKWGLFALAW